MTIVFAIHLVRFPIQVAKITSYNLQGCDKALPIIKNINHREASKED